ncbi:MAG: rhomboid family intramembrane serine protease, partial [Bacteroidota bacterium]
VIVNLVKVVMVGIMGFQPNQNFDDFLQFLALSSDGWYNLTHPWVIITSMFLHEGFWHILWNMLFLYWFGRIVGDLIGDHHILPLYLLAGIAGGLAFFITASILPYGEFTRFALGASGAVMGIVVASAVTHPDNIMHLILIGPVKLKYVVAVLVFLDLIGIANLSNTGGHFAHIGGALFGWFYISRLRSGQDLSVPVNNFVNSIGNFFRGLVKSDPQKPRRKREAVFKKMKPRGSARPNSVTDTEDFSHQERLDAILEKIKKKGYDSLTDEEKDFLYNASKKD